MPNSYQIVADESVDFRVIKKLREIGFHVYAIIESSPAIKDEEVLQIATENKALLITEDKDFGELVFRLNFSHKGILLIREIEGVDKIPLVVDVIERNFHDLKDKFSVIDSKQLRIKI